MNVRKEKLEQLFAQQLGDLSPRSEILDLVRAAARDAWLERLNNSEAIRQKRLSRLRKLGERRNRLVDADLDNRGD